LNPVIYTLRNKDITLALKKLFIKLLIWENWILRRNFLISSCN
jgi:hypothetical protein